MVPHAACAPPPCLPAWRRGPPALAPMWRCAGDKLPQDEIVSACMVSAYLPRSWVVRVRIAEAALHNLNRWHQGVKATGHHGLCCASATSDGDTPNPWIHGSQKQSLLNQVLPNNGSQWNGPGDAPTAVILETFGLLALHVDCCRREAGTVKIVNVAPGSWPS
jgi:hypothetical protein